jgi:hypothetical protein
MIMKVQQLFFLFLFFAFSVYSSPADERESHSSSHETPEKILEDLKKKSAIDGRESLSSTDKEIEELVSVINTYYSQFSQEKRILEDKLRGVKIGINNSTNVKRLIVNEIQSSLSETFLIRDSEALYSIYNRLGDLYSEKLGSNLYYRSKAIESYLAALRYRDFYQSEEKFLDKNLWQRVRSSEELTLREAHWNAKEAYQQSKKKYEEEKKKFYRELSAIANSESSKTSDVQPGVITQRKNGESNLLSLKKELDEKEKAYRLSKETNLAKLVSQKAEADSKVIVNLAKLVKSLEDEVQSDFKIERQTRLYGNDPSIVYDSGRNTRYFAYKDLLEFANRLFPTAKSVKLLLAEETYLSGQYNFSIQHFEDFIRLSAQNLTAEKTASIDELYRKEREAFLKADDETIAELKNAFHKLGSMYSFQKRYVPSAAFYERFIDLEVNEAKRELTYYSLAKLYSDRLGDKERASIYYSKWLALNSDKSYDQQTQLNEQLENYKKVFEANYHLYQFDRFVQKPLTQLINLILHSDINTASVSQLTSIERAYKAYLTMKNVLEMERRSLEEVAVRYEQIKRALLYKTTEEDYAKYVVVEQKLKEAKQRVALAEGRFHSIHKTKVLFSLAELLEKSKDFEKAEFVYREIISLGNDQEISNAFENIERINQFLSNGVYKEVIRMY